MIAVNSNYELCFILINEKKKIFRAVPRIFLSQLMNQSDRFRHPFRTGGRVICAAGCDWSTGDVAEGSGAEKEANEWCCQWAKRENPS